MPKARARADRKVDLLIADTAGRLHVDEDLMDEVARSTPRWTAGDAPRVPSTEETGQDAGAVARSVHQAPAANRRSS